MDAGMKKLEECYLGAGKFQGHGIRVHKVPHDTDSLGYDRYREGVYPKESAMISKPDKMSATLKQEYRALLRHCSASLYRIEFQRCHEPDCVLCRDHVERDCPLNDFLKRFPHERLPSPIPMLPAFPPEMFQQRWYREANWSSGRVESNPVLEGLTVPRNPRTDQGRSAVHRVAGHYRTFGDLLRSPLPRSSPYYSTDYYRGSSRRFRCVQCRLPRVLGSDAAFRRHHAIMHMHDDECESGPSDRIA